MFSGNGSARELVMFAQDDADKAGAHRYFGGVLCQCHFGLLLNGEHQPTIVIRPGEVMHWHLVNPSSFYPYIRCWKGMICTSMPVMATFNQRYRLQNRETVDAGLKMSDWPGNYLYPGGRLSMVFKASMTEGVFAEVSTLSFLAQACGCRAV
ncbi:hypothetical protein J4714_13115 [Staphylococcus epidermidis]|nr:hypothetical protein [Staphylococcus epidermidis]